MQQQHDANALIIIYSQVISQIAVRFRYPRHHHIEIVRDGASCHCDYQLLQRTRLLDVREVRSHHCWQRLEHRQCGDAFAPATEIVHQLPRGHVHEVSFVDDQEGGSVNQLEQGLNQSERN